MSYVCDYCDRETENPSELLKYPGHDGPVTIALCGDCA